MRWEMRPRLFLRTAEFLWQEGHTAHETATEAVTEATTIHQLYADFLRDILAIPVVMGEKTEAERFPGAEMTLTVEAMVQDRKAIQAGTSHFMGQNFSQAQDISFVDRENVKQFAHTTSWGVSTRLIGTLIMAHSDDDGLVLPPRVAPKQIVIIPVTPKEESRQAILDACQALATTLGSQTFHNQPLRVHVDDRDMGGGQKKWDWVKKGVPLRIEIGPRDLESQKVCLQRRDQPIRDKQFLDREEFLREVQSHLDEVHQALLQRATTLREEGTSQCFDMAAFEEHWNSPDNPGWLLTPWHGSREQEEELSKKHKISIRCIPLIEDEADEAPCLLTSEPTRQRALWGRSY